MKNFLISFLVFIALIVLFSVQDAPDEPTTHRGSGTKVQGNSGAVIPGDGAEPVEVIPQTEPVEEIPQAEPVEEKEETKTKPNPPKSPMANRRPRRIQPCIVVDRANGTEVFRLCNQQVFLLPKRRKWGNTTKKNTRRKPNEQKNLFIPI